jgi:hypothetical protein
LEILFIKKVAVLSLILFWFSYKFNFQNNIIKMGNLFFDQYSILHMASGIVAYFWGIKLNYWIIIHVLFEYLENTEIGMKFINNTLKNIWPGGKEKADTFMNSMIGDNFFAILGWCIAYYFDEIYKNKN